MGIQQLCVSTDYNMFKFDERNRPINQRHVGHLAELIKQSNDLVLHPIIVSADGFVLDGQHRLKAAEILGLAYYYLIDYSGNKNKMITINTSQRKWLIEDYLNYWCNNGNEGYIKLVNLVKKANPLSVKNVMVWSSDRSRAGGSMVKLLQKGNYVYNFSQEDEELLLEARDLIQVMRDQKLTIKIVFSCLEFHRALKAMLTSPIVDKDRFIQNIHAYPVTYNQCTSFSSILTLFADIYNKRRLTGRVGVLTGNHPKLLLIEDVIENKFNFGG